MKNQLYLKGCKAFETKKDIRCPLEYGLEIFGGKWKSRIICVLASTLKELLADGIIARHQFNEIPPHVEYCLTDKKIFTQQAVQDLFLSVGWISGTYPCRLYKALLHSSTVLTAWDGDQLAGLVRLLDDSEMVAYIHYVLVHPDYQGQGIAGRKHKYSFAIFPIRINNRTSRRR